jgi:hypothetical protein
VPIPLVLTVAKIASVAVRLKPFIVALGGRIFTATRMGSISKFLGGIAKPVFSFLGKIFKPVFGWAAKLFPWIAAAFAPQLASRLVQSVQQVWHFNWKISENQLREDIKSAVTNLYEPLGEFVGRSIATVLVGRGLGGNNIPKIRINTGQIARLIELSGGSETIRDSLIDAVTDIWYAVKSAAQLILMKFLYLNGRQFVEKVTGQELGGEKEGESFVFAEKFEEKVRDIVPGEEAQDAVINGFEVFFDTIGDLLTEEDLYAEYV